MWNMFYISLPFIISIYKLYISIINLLYFIFDIQRLKGMHILHYTALPWYWRTCSFELRICAEMDYIFIPPP